MIPLLAQQGLLAAGKLVVNGGDSPSAWRHMGDKFDGRRATFEWSEIYAILGVLVLLAVLAAIAYAGQWLIEKYSQQPHPRRLFRELCQNHQLSRQERRTLRELSHKLDHPGALFVRPELLGEDAAVLRAKLFADVIG